MSLFKVILFVKYLKTRTMFLEANKNAKMKDLLAG